MLILLFGLVRWPTVAYDPFAPRLAFAVVALALVGGTYHNSVFREHIRLAGILFCGALFAWFTYVAYRHSMGMEDIAGMLPIVGGASILFRRWWELLVYIIFIAVDLAIGHGYTDAPKLSFSAFFAVLATSMLMLGSMSVWRSRLVEAVRVTNDTLEQRTRDLESKNASLAEALSSLQRAQEQLVHSEKMASLGLLVAGIAHELKNPLNFVNNFSELSREFAVELKERQAHGVGISPEEIEDSLNDIIENLTRISEHGRRADGIINNMLTHTRDRHGDLSPVNLDAMITENVTLAYQGFCAGDHSFVAEIHYSLDPLVGRAMLPHQELARVVVNLVSNACHAMRERVRRGVRVPEAQLRVTTRRLGTIVEFVVADNGTGIPHEIQRRIFDPFFTTKPPGEGTGLGLSMSYEIVVKELGGTISFESSEGEGTIFTVRVPAPPVQDE